MRLPAVPSENDRLYREWPPSVLHSHTILTPFDYQSLLRRRPPSQPQAVHVTPPSTKHPPSSPIIASTRRRPSPHTVPSQTRARKSSALYPLRSSSLILACDRQRPSLHTNLLGHASVCMHAQVLRAVLSPRTFPPLLPACRLRTHALCSHFCKALSLNQDKLWQDALANQVPTPENQVVSSTASRDP